MSIPVDSIKIPSEFVMLANDWYNGQGDLLYAVSSTGGLTLGSQKPKAHWTDEQWYLHVWRGLAADVCSAMQVAVKGRDDDAQALSRFHNFASQTVGQLEAAYKLSDWDDE